MPGFKSLLHAPPRHGEPNFQLYPKQTDQVPIFPEGFPLFASLNGLIDDGRLGLEPRRLEGQLCSRGGP